MSVSNLNLFSVIHKANVYGVPLMNWKEQKRSACSYYLKRSGLKMMTTGIIKQLDVYDLVKEYLRRTAS